MPEYLREPRKSRHWFPAVACLVVAVSFIVVALNMFGQFEPGTPLGDMLVRGGLIEAPREVATRPEGKATGVGDEGRAKRESPSSKQTAAESPKPSAKPLAVEAAPEKAAGKETSKGVAEPTAKEPVKMPVKPSPAGPAKEPVKTPAVETPVKPERPRKNRPPVPPQNPSRCRRPKRRSNLSPSFRWEVP